MILDFIIGLEGKWTTKKHGDIEKEGKLITSQKKALKQCSYNNTTDSPRLEHTVRETYCETSCTYAS